MWSLGKVIVRVLLLAMHVGKGTELLSQGLCFLPNDCKSLETDAAVKCPAPAGTCVIFYRRDRCHTGHT